MEKTLVIEGEKIHHIGYRPFLLKEAMNRKITNFQAENMIGNNGKEKQKVIVKMVGEEGNVSEFVSFIKKTENGNIPDYAKNCNVIIEEDKCSSEVMYISDYRDRLAVEQQDNIVQGGLRIEESLGKMNIKLDGMDTKLGNIDTKLDGMNAKLDGMNTKLGDIDTKLDGMNTKLGDIDTKLDGMNTKLGNIDTKLGSFIEEQKVFNREQIEINKELKNTNNRIEKTEKNIERLLEILVKEKEEKMEIA